MWSGEPVVPYLVERGHKVLNLDLKPLDAPGVRTIVVNLADSGETFNALSMHFDFEDLKAGGSPAPLDAVVHFAAILRRTQTARQRHVRRERALNLQRHRSGHEVGDPQGHCRLQHNGLRRLLCGGRPGLHELPRRRGL